MILYTAPAMSIDAHKVQQKQLQTSNARGAAGRRGSKEAGGRAGLIDPMRMLNDPEAPAGGNPTSGVFLIRKGRAPPNYPNWSGCAPPPWTSVHSDRIICLTDSEPIRAHMWRGDRASHLCRISDGRR
jgi:hypothetical protein